MKIENYPVLKALFPFVCGILCCYFCNILPHYGRILLLTTVIFCLFSILLWPVRKLSLQWLHAWMLFCGFFFAGATATNFRMRAVPTEQSEKLTSHNTTCMVRVMEHPAVRARSVKLVVEPLQDSLRMCPSLRRFLLYVQRSAGSDSLQYGDVLALSTTLSPLDPPTNPDAFDNQRYMRRRGICYSGYVPDGAWQCLGNAVPNQLKHIAFQWQQRLSALFLQTGMSGAEYEIIKAILLGDDDTMEPDLKAAYASAGVSHVLCVSGMHVGVIFMILNFLLKPMDFFKGTRALKAILLLSSIWLYACITGLSPSVTRSATMFSFVTVGGLLRRNVNVFHSLLASLFILLTLNPLLLFEVGFQLSYLAVFGIVAFQPMIANLYHCKTKVGNYFWELLLVSIAAQLSTFPISIYYFGQFPNYFILSNLSVISLSFIVMITGIGLLGLSFIPMVAHGVAAVLTFEIRVMNRIILFIEQLPGSVTHNIDYRMHQVLLLYLAIVLTFMAFQYQRKRMLLCAWAVMTLFAGTFALRKVGLLHQNEVVAYDVPHATAFAFCYRQQGVLLSDSVLSVDHRSYKMAMQNHARRQHAMWQFVPIDTSRLDLPFICKRGAALRYRDKTYYLLKKHDPVYVVKHPLPVDYLVLRNGPTQSPEDVASALRFQTVIADQSNGKFCIEKWRQWCRENGVIFQCNR